jgi:hypothetical protein
LRDTGVRPSKNVSQFARTTATGAVLLADPLVPEAAAE